MLSLTTNKCLEKNVDYNSNLVVLNRPAQAVLCIDMTQWTKDTEKAISDGKDGLPKYLKKLDQEVSSNLTTATKDRLAGQEEYQRA